MNLDDLLCVGVTDNILISSTIGRNKTLIPAEVISSIINGTEELLDELEILVLVFIPQEVKKDVGDLVRTIIVDSTVVCRMPRKDVISNDKISAETLLLAFVIWTASYEKNYNGGMGSNGLTSARHDVFHSYLAEAYPETYDHSLPKELVYSEVRNYVMRSTTHRYWKILLSPTRTYTHYQTDSESHRENITSTL